jgi:5'-nucleotidase/UDP-sugar diphosphatase
VKRPNIVLCSIFLLILSVSIAHGEQVEIRILYLNDFHGFAEPYKPFGSDEMYGGIAYLAGEVDHLRKEKASLLLSAGDMIQGNNWTNLFRGESTIELMNLMRFDAMVVGNHEFDFGQDVLRRRISESKFPVLGANVEGLDLLKPFLIKELNGVRVAVIGVVTEDTLISTYPRNVAGLRFVSPIDTVEKYIKELKDRSDVVVVLSHIGYPADRILAENVRGIDVIVGGHSHTKLTKPVMVRNTIIVQAWEHGKSLGVLDLMVEGGKIVKFEGCLEEIKPKTGKADPTALAVVKKYREKEEALLNEKVGEAEVDLDGENVRRMETNLGNLISDIMRYTSGADVTIINGGGIRASIKKGELRVKDVYSVLPFENYIVAIKLTGKQITEALEYGVSGVEDEEGGFPQVSGLTFEYSPSERKGLRIKKVCIQGKLIDLDKEYIVATNDFLAAGGDGYKVFAEAGMMKGEKVVYNSSGQWLRDTVFEYIKGMKRVAPKVEGRIIEIR